MFAVIRLPLHTSLNTLSLIIDTNNVDFAVINAKPSERNLSTYDSHYEMPYTCSSARTAPYRFEKTRKVRSSTELSRSILQSTLSIIEVIATSIPPAEISALPQTWDF